MKKKQEDGFLDAIMTPMAAPVIAAIASSLIQPVASSFIKVISVKGVTKAGKEQEGGFLPLLALPLMMKILGKGATRTGRRYNNMDCMNKNF